MKTTITQNSQEYIINKEQILYIQRYNWTKDGITYWNVSLKFCDGISLDFTCLREKASLKLTQLLKNNNSNHPSIDLDAENLHGN